MESDQSDSRTTAVFDVGSDAGRNAVRNRLWVYRVAMLVLAGVVASLVVDAASGSLAIWGVDAAHVRDSDADLELEVTYTEVARPGLAAPFHVTVTREGGFDNDIELAFPAEYFRLWDVNGLFPEPKEWRSEGDRLVFTFAPPEHSDRFEWFYEARIEPAQQSGRDGYVAVLDAGAPEVMVRFHTRLMP